MSPVLPREHELWLSRRSVASLGVYSVQWAAGKQRINLAVTQQIVSKSFTKQRFQAPVAYWLFGLLNMNIIRLNMRIACYSDADSALNETKQ